MPIFFLSPTSNVVYYISFLFLLANIIAADFLFAAIVSSDFRFVTPDTKYS